jgi:N-acetylneuraminic acid mutarotase
MSAPRLTPTLVIMTALAATAAETETPRHGWQLLAPLPDPVGYAGMFAGVLDGRVVAGGGSQFREKPNWLHGEKTFSDRLFVLSDPMASWSESAVRLPMPMASSASACTSDAIYLVGGINATGCLRHAWELRPGGEQREGFRFTPLPDFPHPIGYATAAIAQGRLHVFGGLPDPASKTPSIETWSLALADAPARSWRREPDWPVSGVFLCSAASEGESIFAVGGLGFDAAGKATPSARCYRLAPAANAWQRIADLPEARVGAATPCALVDAGKFFVIGGYAEVFPGAPRDYPGFCAQTFLYEPARNAWSTGPLLPRTPVTDRDSPSDPGPVPMIGAPCVVWRGRVVVVSGEVRASVRSPQVLAWPLAAPRP